MMFEEEDFGEENLLVGTKTEYDVEENVLRPKAMSDYVGQQKVKENRLRTFLSVFEREEVKRLLGIIESALALCLV